MKMKRRWLCCRYLVSQKTACLIIVKSNLAFVRVLFASKNAWFQNSCWTKEAIEANDHHNISGHCEVVLVTTDKVDTILTVPGSGCVLWSGSGTGSLADTSEVCSETDSHPSIATLKMQGFFLFFSFEVRKETKAAQKVCTNLLPLDYLRWYTVTRWFFRLVPDFSPDRIL